MSTVTIRRKLRPLRLAYLVRHDDRAAILRAIEANSCIWGGRYNAIVPLYEREAKVGTRRWRRDDFARGYLDRFEPDFVIDLTSEAEGLFDSDRILKEEDAFDRSRHGVSRYGLGINTLYTDLYNKEYRFTQRHKSDRFVSPHWTDPSLDMLLSAAFGRFPDEAPQLRRNYEEVFEAVTEDVTSKNFYKLLRSGTPSKMTIAGTRAGFSGPLSPAVFVLNHDRPADIIDYWNLRALGWQLVPFPLRWRAELMESARELLHKQLDWYATNRLLRVPIMLLGARSISRATLAEYATAFGLGASLPLRSLSIYPPIWIPEEHSYHTERCSVIAKEDEIERALPETGPGSFVRLDPLAPEFKPSIPYHIETAWANVISVSSNESLQAVAPVIPVGVHDAEALLGSVFRRSASIMREGIVIYGGHSSHLYVHLPSPEEVARAWFRGRGFVAKPSAAGLVAQSIAKAIKGLYNAESLAHVEVLEKLNALSLGSSPHTHSSSATHGSRPQARVRSESHKRLRGLLLKVRKNSREQADRHLRHLLDSGAIRLGLELACPECTQRSWFSLNAINERLRCERCDSEFSFPAAEPPGPDSWQYRTHGPFSIENYAQGAYAVVLSLRAIMLLIHQPETMWITSTILRSQVGKEIEIDFALWHRDHLTSTVSLLLGEAKTFGLFGEKDFANARILAAEFPGACLVFTTLRAELTPGERKRLRALARAGRQVRETGVWRNPVIVLTGQEILGGGNLSLCWRNLGENFTRAAKIAKPSTDLLSLAQATQLAYLGLEPEEDLLRETYMMRDDDDMQANFLQPRRLRLPRKSKKGSK